MKKLLLIPLLALFCVANVWGDEEVNVSTDAELRTALAESPAGTQINLMNNIEGATVYIVPNTAELVLNLNSYKLSTTYFDDQESWEQNAVIYNQGNLRIISEGKGMIQLPLEGGDAAIICNDGNLTVDGGIYIGKEVNLMGYLLFRLPTIWGNNGSITINGGTFSLANGSGIPEYGIICPGSGSLTINGGRFANTKVGSKTISDYLGKSYIVQNVSFSNTFAPWITSVTCVVPNGTAEITSVESVSDDQEEEAVVVASGAQLTIESGATLTIEGDLTFADENSILVVEPGAKVIVGEEIVAAREENISLTMDAKGKKYSNLLVAADKIQETHPKATVAFNTKCRKVEEEGKDDRFVWQRFAVPSYTSFDLSKLGNAKGYQTAICGWNYTNSRWEILDPTTAVLEPFQCYELTINVTDNDAQYLFPCDLVGNGNPNLTLRAGWNYYANAYTAPLNLKAWLIDLMENFSGTVHGTVYVQKPGEKNSWYEVTYADAKDNMLTASQSQLQPMQAFIYYGKKSTTIPLKYKEYVYDPIVNSGVALAPLKARTEDEYKMAMIVIEDAEGEEEYLRLYEGAQFSDAFDNGYDAMKLMNDEVFNAYFVTPIGDLARLAAQNVEDANITFKTYDASEFTMTFQNVTLEGYSIKDNLTGTTIELKNGKSYVFSGEEQTLYSSRFTIVKSGETTAIENTEAASKAKGIYTLTGVYVGTNLNILPAGVYVVNGEKVVR